MRNRELKKNCTYGDGCASNVGTLVRYSKRNIVGGQRNIRRIREVGIEGPQNKLVASTSTTTSDLHVREADIAAEVVDAVET